MPGAVHTVALQRPFRQRAAQMRARLPNSIDSPILTHQENPDPLDLDANGFAFGQFGFWKHGHKSGRRLLALRVVRADPLFVDQTAAEIGGDSRDQIPCQGADPGGISLLLLTQNPRGRKKSGRADIEQAVYETNFARLSIRLMPVRQTRDSRARRANQSYRNCRIRPFCMPIVAP